MFSRKLTAVQTLVIAGCIGVAGIAYSADWDDERAARAFIQLDSDNSQSLTLEEFRAGVQDGRFDDAEKLFKRFDTDGDGLVLHRDLRGMWDKANNFLRKDIYKVDPASQNRVMEQVFVNMDADGDDKLSAEEFNSGFTPQKAEHASREFDRVDDNRDGGLSRAEFTEDWNRFRKNLMRDVYFHEPRGQIQARAFEALDADASGSLTIHEYVVSLDRPQDRRALASFRAMDHNTDGLVSPEEFTTAWPTVVTLIRRDVYVAPLPLGIEREQVIEERREVIIERETVRGPRAVFGRIDRDRDDRLTVYEYQAGIGGSAADATRRFYRLDRDFDGYLDSQEFELEADADVKIEVESEVDVDD